MSELKTKKTNASVQAFIDKVTDTRKREDSLAVLKMMREVTGLEPAMWGDSMVGFGSYAYRYASGHSGEWFRIGFSPRKRNLTIYILPQLSEYESILVRLGKHKLGKSCLYINKLADVDTDVLKELLTTAYQHFSQ